MADEGVIFKALSGFYYIKSGDDVISCRARGRFRHENITPLVGDLVSYTRSGNSGMIDKILPRKNSLIRPAVANVDQIVMVVSETIPVTDPFLIDKMTAIAEHHNIEPVICINKCDLSDENRLYNIYKSVGYKVVKTSAVTGEGISELTELLSGKTSVFTGNSGVGKSSILNAVEPGFSIDTNDVSYKLGRGKHTTRHIEFYYTKSGAVIADTPGFSSFDLDKLEFKDETELQYVFTEFSPYLDKCQFIGCSHTKEKGCAVLEAVKNGEIQKSRHDSYVRIYNQLKEIPHWDK
jgi:ribosome biogenesis GTPase